jgi:hypothetical protein
VFYATHAGILTSARSTALYSTASTPAERSPTTPAEAGARGFGIKLEPRYIFRAGSLDQ